MLEIGLTHIQNDLRRLSRQIKQDASSKAIRRELTKGLRNGAKPALKAVRLAALTLPDAPGNSSTGLLKNMAAAAQIEVRTGGKNPTVRIKLNRQRLGKQASVALSTNKGKWRHPVYGNRSKWVTQRSKRGWFDNANASKALVVRKEMQNVITEIENKFNHH